MSRLNVIIFMLSERIPAKIFAINGVSRIFYTTTHLYGYIITCSVTAPESG